MTFSKIISDLRKETNQDIYLTEEEKNMPTELRLLQYVLGIQSCTSKKQVVKILLEIQNQAKLDQTLLCKRIAEDENKRLLDFLNIREGVLEDSRKEVYQLVSDLEVEKQKHKDFVEKLRKTILDLQEISTPECALNRFIEILAELESEVKDEI